MLHAFARHKSKAYKRYLRMRDDDEPRVSSEDEITSIIFGPLDFLPASDIWVLWEFILGNHASDAMSGPLPPDFFPGFFPIACTHSFWPRKGKVEPDLLVKFTDVTGVPRSLLIEVKWDAGVSGADQLEKQWQVYQSGEHASSLHVFLAKRMDDWPLDVRPWASESSPEAASRLRAIRWHDFKHEVVKLARMPDTSTLLKRWCTLAIGFLEQVNIHPFVGFHSSIRLANHIDSGSTENGRFWSGPAISQLI
jgi:hypothetical protein